jgi:hypothetical protein
MPKPSVAQQREIVKKLSNPEKKKVILHSLGVTKQSGSGLFSIISMLGPLVIGEIIKTPFGKSVVNQAKKTAGKVVGSARRTVGLGTRLAGRGTRLAGGGTRLAGRGKKKKAKKKK